MKIPGLGNDKTDEQKAKEAFREKAAIQDSVNTGKLEQAAFNQSQRKKQGSNELLNPEEDKKRIKQLLLNVKQVKVKPRYYVCNNCKTKHEKTVDECENCSGEDFKVKEGEEQLRYKQAPGTPIINFEGFQKVVWSEMDTAINATVSGGYLSRQEISKLNYSTLSTITMQLAIYPYRYGIANASDMQQIGDIMRPILISNTSKARGGRGLQNQEKTVVEKISRALGEEDKEDDDNGVIF